MIDLSSINHKNKPLILLLAYSLLAMLGVADAYTGYELGFSIFYVFPISLVVWSLGRTYGIVISIVSAAVWLKADLVDGHVYSNQLIPVWNAFIRFSFFLIIVLLLAALKKSMEREQRLARTDPLTGAINSLHFYELLEIEINRLQRYKNPFTLAYIDLDNFKKINDQSGHHIGDAVLVDIVKNTKKNLRKTDMVARIGGDEFVILFPDTLQDNAKIVLTKLQTSLLEEMSKNNWPVTFSIGALTCMPTSFDASEIIKKADNLMYDVKNKGKNAISYGVFQ